jgi:hypothetical protein
MARSWSWGWVEGAAPMRGYAWSNGGCCCGGGCCGGGCSGGSVAVEEVWQG